MITSIQSENSHGAGPFHHNDLLKVLSLYKNRGETPLECLERFRKDNPEYKDEKMTYAGRLDPLAEGLLLVLVGEECKNKEKYLGLDKEYEVDVLFGFSTDTYDLLGKVTANNESSKNKIIDENLFKPFVGKFSQKYPPFSSKTIKGKTLFSLFKSGELKDEEIPEKDVEIKSIELLSERKISKDDLEKYIKESVALVKGDFRQKEILETWHSVFASVAKQSSPYQIISIKVNCTSGTYMRSLADAIGKKTGIPALALNIRRTKLGSSL
jgi:tRNA pseudouridine55 synthase